MDDIDIRALNACWRDVLVKREAELRAQRGRSGLAMAAAMAQTKLAEQRYQRHLDDAPLDVRLAWEAER